MILLAIIYQNILKKNVIRAPQCSPGAVKCKLLHVVPCAEDRPIKSRGFPFEFRNRWWTFDKKLEGKKTESLSRHPLRTTIKCWRGVQSRGLDLERVLGVEILGRMKLGVVTWQNAWVMWPFEHCCQIGQSWRCSLKRGENTRVVLKPNGPR